MVKFHEARVIFHIFASINHENLNVPAPPFSLDRNYQNTI